MSQEFVQIQIKAPSCPASTLECYLIQLREVDRQVVPDGCPVHFATIPPPLQISPLIATNKFLQSQLVNIWTQLSGPLSNPGLQIGERLKSLSLKLILRAMDGSRRHLMDHGNPTLPIPNLSLLYPIVQGAGGGSLPWGERSRRPILGRKKIYSIIGQDDFLASLYASTLAIQTLTPTFSHPNPNLSTSSF